MEANHFWDGKVNSLPLTTNPLINPELMLNLAEQKETVSSLYLKLRRVNPENSLQLDEAVVNSNATGGTFDYCFLTSTELQTQLGFKFCVFCKRGVSHFGKCASLSSSGLEEKTDRTVNEKLRPAAS